MTISKGFDPATGATAVSVFGAAAVISALLFGWLSDRYGRSRMLAASYLVRGAGTLLLALNLSSELAYYGVVALAIGPTFGTVAVGNVMFYEIVGPRMAGVILGLSFIVHQVGSAGGPMIAKASTQMRRQTARRCTSPMCGCGPTRRVDAQISHHVAGATTRYAVNDTSAPVSSAAAVNRPRSARRPPPRETRPR